MTSRNHLLNIALDHAAESGFSTIAALLLDNGAEVYNYGADVGKHNASPLSCCKQWEDRDG